MKKFFPWCLVLFVLLFSLSAFPLNVSAIETDRFISYDVETGNSRYETIPLIEEDNSIVYSPPGKGDLDAIEGAYEQINEMRAEQNTCDNIIMPYTIIGSDDRTKVGAEICTPYSRICYLEIA